MVNQRVTIPTITASLIWGCISGRKVIKSIFFSVCLLTDIDGWKLCAGGRRSWVCPGARVPHRLQPFLLQVRESVSRASVLPKMEAQHPCGDGGIHKGHVIQGAQISHAAPAESRRLYSTVMVGGTAKWWRLAATWWLTTRAGLIHLRWTDGKFDYPRSSMERMTKKGQNANTRHLQSLSQV